MANILNLLTIGEQAIYYIDSNPSQSPGLAALPGSVAIVQSSGGTVGEQWVKIGAGDTDWDKVVTATAGGNVGQGAFRRLAIYDETPNGYHVDDTVTQNGKSIDILIAAQPGRADALEYTIPNPGNSVTAVDFVLTEGDQTINGDKTFGNSVTINGDLDVKGTFTTIESTVTTIKDPTITLNKGGATASGAGAGIEIEENNVIKGYVQIDSTRNGWAIKAPNNNYEADILLSSLTADHSYTLPDINGTFTLGTGASNRVAFWNGTNSVTSSANLYWDSSANRLGVNTSAPSADLHVLGSARITGLVGPAPVRSDALGNLSNGTIVLSAASDVSGVLPIANGGTNSSTALNNKRIMVSSGGAIVEAAALADGQLLIGSTGNAPVAAALSQGANQSVTITNGAGSITLDAAQDIRTTASPSFVNVTLSGKTSGSVIFAGSGGALSEDNANLFWDNNNDRLGIGTTSPARNLDVNGDVKIRGPLLINDATATKANFEIKQAEITTTTAGVATIATIPVASGDTALIEARIVGKSTTGDSATYVRTARFKNVGGTASMFNLQSDYTSEDQAAWNGTLTISGGNAIVNVIGAASTTIDWTVTYSITTL